MSNHKLRHFLLLAMCFLTLGVWAQPQAGKWYYITFVSSGNVVTSHGEGGNVLTNALVSGDNQQWTATGSEDDGYILTDKAGLKLYFASTDKRGTASASATNAGTPLTFVKMSDGNFEIRPKSNNSVAFNQFGGAKDGAQVGLWDAGSDQGNRIKFVEALSEEEYAKVPRIIPWPAEITYDVNKKYNVKNLTSVVYSDANVKDVIDDFLTQLNATAGTSLTATQGNAAAANATLALVHKQLADSAAYELTVTDNGITISAGARPGFFYGIQTLKQLLPNAYFGKTAQPTADWSVTQVNISDAPKFSHRGFMLDCARHFFSKEEVKRVLDIMALYKLDRFHWHLTDDQGWRIEIPEYPKLTTVGSRRKGSFVNAAAGFFDDTEYGRGMYYTLDDLREIVAYAKARNIEIMPEVDLPGHMVAALASYPNLSCDSTRTYEVRQQGGISRDVLNIGDDHVIDFLKCVLGHVAEVFPWKYIHLGGDECPTDNWKNNEMCLKRVRDNNLTGVDQLQSWLVEQLGEFLKTKYNKDIVVWDELLRHWNDANKVKPVIMAWNGDGYTVTAANHNFQSIYVPYQKLYIDMMQVSVNDADVNETYQGGWGDGYVNTVATVYNADPTGNIRGAGKDESFVLGPQVNLWTETTNDSVQLEYQLLPRMLALSEIGWLPYDKKDWNSFYHRLQGHAAIFDNLGYTYAKHYFKKPELTAVQAARKEASELISATKADQAGYASNATLQALQTALNATPETATDATALQTAIAAFKAAPVVQPDTAAYYQIISASTYYKLRFVGSSLYRNGNGLRIHYTKQNDPNELWKFAKDGNNLYLVDARTGDRVAMPKYNENVTFSAQGTPIRVDGATFANKQYDHVPGVVVISATEGYSKDTTNSVKRIFAANSGVVKAYDDPQLCRPGTWTLLRVDDFGEMLKSLVKKCENIISDADTTKYGNPTSNAVKFLQSSIITPGKTRVNTGATVSVAEYNQYAALYAQYEAMPKRDNGPWATTFDKNSGYSSGDRHLDNVQMGSVTVPVNNKKMFNDATAYSFVVAPGATLAPKVGYNGQWMNGYIYIDRGSDGVFSSSINDNGTPAEGTDLMAYSFYSGDEENDTQGFNSTGKSLTGPSRNTKDIPSFTLPTLNEGFYRMRYKVDWNSINPGGNTTDGNGIVKNRGGVTDIRLRVTSATEGNVSATGNGCTLTTADGTSLNGTKATLGQALTFKVGGIGTDTLLVATVRHGILTGDSIVNNIAQRAMEVLSFPVVADGTYTIPAYLVDGDLNISVSLGTATGISEVTVDGKPADDIIYDLQGRRVNRSTAAGVYIKNGRKVVVK